MRGRTEADSAKKETLALSCSPVKKAASKAETGWPKIPPTTSILGPHYMLLAFPSSSALLPFLESIQMEYIKYPQQRQCQPQELTAALPLLLACLLDTKPPQAFLWIFLVMEPTSHEYYSSGLNYLICSCIAS